MNSNFTQNKIKTMSSGSAQPQLTKKVVEELYISRPQKKEQQKNCPNPLHLGQGYRTKGKTNRRKRRTEKKD